MNQAIPKPVKKKQAEEVIVFENKKKKKEEQSISLTNQSNKKIKQNERREETKKFEKYRDDKRQKEDDNDDKEENTMSLKQAKFDVYKFGIKGFDKEEQENARIKLAMKLGAAPPKNKFVNYKELQEKKREEKQKKDQLVKENRLFEAKIMAQKNGVQVKKRQRMSDRRRANINRGRVGNIKGHIGSFNNGLLKLRKIDMKKLNI